MISRTMYSCSSKKLWNHVLGLKFLFPKAFPHFSKTSLSRLATGAGQTPLEREVESIEGLRRFSQKPPAEVPAGTISTGNRKRFPHRCSHWFMGKLYNSIEISHEISGSIENRPPQTSSRRPLKVLRMRGGSLVHLKMMIDLAFLCFWAATAPVRIDPASFFTMNGQVSAVSGYSRPIKAAVHDLIL